MPLLETSHLTEYSRRRSNLAVVQLHIDYVRCPKLGDVTGDVCKIAWRATFRAEIRRGRSDNSKPAFVTHPVSHAAPRANVSRKPF